MKSNILLLVSCLLLFGCMSEAGNKNIQAIIAFELNRSLNRLSKEHIKCYRCEVGEYPKFLSQVIELRPVSNKCRSLFVKEIDFLIPAFANYRITTKEWDDRVTFVFTEQGVAYDDLDSIRGENLFTMSISHFELECEREGAF